MDKKLLNKRYKNFKFCSNLNIVAFQNCFCYIRFYKSSAVLKMAI